MDFENYYKVLDIIDDIAKNNRTPTNQEICIIDTLAKEDDISIADFADANNCEICSTWEEVIEKFKELWKAGERVEVNTNAKI